MSVTVDAPTRRSSLEQFLCFHDTVYAGRGAFWPENVDMVLPTLLGRSPFGRDRLLQPFVALDGGHIVARVLGVVDERYRMHWDERLGHLAMFEALPDTGEATRALLQTACEWLVEHGADAARMGFLPGFDMPFAIDAHDVLPPSILRQNPTYYHALIKDAGFEVEQGFVDYKLRVTPDLGRRWAADVAAARGAGYRLVPVRDVPRRRRGRELSALWSETFAAHWGFSPFIEDELSLLFELGAPVGVLDVSAVAYAGDRPVGFAFVTPADGSPVALAPSRRLRDDERLNTFAIGVRREARGRGVNRALAGWAFGQLARRGATHLSYTLVLDDNWPSRRTAEALGARVCASYLAYRRRLGIPGRDGP
jgi:GNAT superfamily N-acetyltransferase